MAQILVGLQIYKGLADRLPIESTSGTHIQPLDYEGLPFRCHRYHELGHLVAKCPKVAHVNPQKSVGTKSCGERPAYHSEAGQ